MHAKYYDIDLYIVFIIAVKLQLNFNVNRVTKYPIIRFVFVDCNLSELCRIGD